MMDNSGKCFSDWFNDPDGTLKLVKYVNFKKLDDKEITMKNKPMKDEKKMPMKKKGKK